jgi:hypothetical protein
VYFTLRARRAQGIVRAPWHRLVTGRAAQVDDRPATRPQRRQSRLRDERRAVDVGLELPTNHLFARLLERSELEYAGVVDDHVEPTRFANGALDRRGHFAPIGASPSSINMWHAVGLR